MRFFCALLICVSFFNSLTTCLADVGAKDVLAQALFPTNPTPGSQRYGCTYDNGWVYGKQTGTVQVQGDDNRDGVKDSSEIRTEPYRAYYTVELWGEVHDLTGADMAQSKGAFVYAARALTEGYMTQGQPITVGHQIGDIDVAKRVTRDVSSAESTVPRYRYDEVVVASARGPFVLRATVCLYVVVAGEHLDDYHSTPEWVVDKDRLDAQIAGWRAHKLQVAVDVLTQTMRPLDAWCRKPMADGPGFRGLYPLITPSLFPSTGELPTNIVVHKPTEMKEPQQSWSIYYDQVKPNQSAYSPTEPHYTYRLDALVELLSSSDAKDTDVIDKAHNRISQSGAKQTVMIPGADEAFRKTVRDVGTNQDTIILRKANVILTVTVNEHGKNIPAHPMTSTERWAAFLLAKLTGQAPGKLGGAAQIGLSGPSQLWADNVPVKLLLSASGDDGAPMGGVVFTVKESDSMMGGCTQSKVTTDATGKGVITYTPKYPGENILTVSGSPGEASLVIKQGGLLVTRWTNERLDPLGDGKTVSHMTVRCVNPSGGALPGVKVNVTIDQKMLPKPGKLAAIGPSATDAKGEVVFSFLPPDVRPFPKYKAASAAITFTSSVGNPPRKITVPWRLRVVHPKDITDASVKLQLIPAQVLNLSQCDTWIAGKPAVLRARLNWDNPKITSMEADVTYTANDKQLASTTFEFKNQYTRLETASNMDAAQVFYTPDKPGRCDIQVSIDIHKITTQDGKSYSVAPVSASAVVNVVAPSRQIKLLFVPIAVAEWANREKIDEALFTPFRQAQMRFVRAVLPLPSDSVIDATTSTVMFQPEQGYTEPVLTEGAMLARIEALAAQYPGSYVIGVVPEGWFRHAGTSAPRRFPHAGLIYMNPAGASIDTLTAHELTHLLGFSQHNIPAANGSPGVFIWGQTPSEFRVMEPSAGTDFYDYMNEDPTSSLTSWIGVSNYRWLLDRLNRP